MIVVRVVKWAQGDDDGQNMNMNHINVDIEFYFLSSTKPSNV